MHPFHHLLPLPELVETHSKVIACVYVMNCPLTASLVLFSSWAEASGLTL